MVKLTNGEYIKKANEIHNNKYTYIEDYIDNKTKITIVCDTHGKFKLSPREHIGKGIKCPTCLGTNTKCTIVNYNELANKKGYKFMDTIIPRNTGIKCNWLCVTGNHIWITTYSSIRGGNNCAICTKLNNIHNNSQRKTLNEFIREGNKAHNNKYDYSKVEYINSKTNVCIICPIVGHGEFWQNPSLHTNRNDGCPKCGIFLCISKNLIHNKTTAQFIDDAVKIYGTKYDYTKTVYVKSTIKVCIICTIDGHGDFFQEPRSHLNNYIGCSKCKSSARINTIDDFILNAVAVHGDKYDYSRVVYSGSDINVNIICPKLGHGEFLQKPHNHLSGSGCSKCVNESQKTSLNEFIAKAQSVHGDKYDYSKVVYVGALIGIKIICNKNNHGEFSQSPSSHINGKNGCPKCASGRSEGICRELLEDLTGKQFTKIRPDWLNKLELDGYNDELKLAFEYQGKQHTHFIPHYHRRGESDFIDQVARDTLKRQLCVKNGIQVIEVPYTYDFLNPYRMKVFIMIELEKLGFIFTNGNFILN